MSVCMQDCIIVPYTYRRATRLYSGVIMNNVKSTGGVDGVNCTSPTTPSIHLTLPDDDVTSTAAAAATFDR